MNARVSTADAWKGFDGPAAQKPWGGAGVDDPDVAGRAGVGGHGREHPGGAGADGGLQAVAGEQPGLQQVGELGGGAPEVALGTGHVHQRRVRWQRLGDGRDVAEDREEFPVGLDARPGEVQVEDHAVAHPALP
ncbi:hypothetical protein P3T39_007027 [Kitasatospora sp. GP82]|nr:hypothetical protein [Kitasatospora sp. GP82]